MDWMTHLNKSLHRAFLLSVLVAGFLCELLMGNFVLSIPI
jgi:hypothetical protein